MDLIFLSRIKRALNTLLVKFSLERLAFRAKMKGHYKGEFNMAALLRQKPPVDDDEDEDDD